MRLKKYIIELTLEELKAIKNVIGKTSPNFRVKELEIPESQSILLSNIYYDICTIIPDDDED